MALRFFAVNLLCIVIVKGLIVNDTSDNRIDNNDNIDTHEPADVFNGVYTECFLYLSYNCLQKKTLLYLRQLDNLHEVSVIGDYVKYVKVNHSEVKEIERSTSNESEDLSFMIDKEIHLFFDNHVLKFNALGKDITIPNAAEDFVGRKRKGGGGGGGGGGHGGGHGGDDGGKKKMMMMAMMCMKMKLMMMVPAMMGMMGMMSFKGMMFSMMSFMISKMMLLMKILEKKGLGGGGDSGGWAAGGGGGGGAWMPAGGQDYGGGGGGGYDANGQWQSRSIIEDKNNIDNIITDNNPIISYLKPGVRYNSYKTYNAYNSLKSLNDEVIKPSVVPKSRRKRGIVDVIQNAYVYWMKKVLGLNSYKKAIPKFKYVNGMKYVYYPVRPMMRPKAPKELSVNHIKPEEVKTVVNVEDFNKGEIVDSPVEARMNRRKFQKMKDMSQALDESPWQ